MRCRWTSTRRWSVLWNLLVLRSYSTRTLGLWSRAAMWLNAGKIFHSNSINSPSTVSKVLYCDESMHQLNFFPKQCLMLGSDSSFQGMTQNLKIHKPLHARDWRLLHHWPEITVSIKNLPSYLDSLNKSHLIVRLSSFRMCQTLVSLWDLFLYCFDGM